MVLLPGKPTDDVRVAIDLRKKIVEFNMASRAIYDIGTQIF